MYSSSRLILSLALVVLLQEHAKAWQTTTNTATTSTANSLFGVGVVHGHNDQHTKMRSQSHHCFPRPSWRGSGRGPRTSISSPFLTNARKTQVVLQSSATIDQASTSAPTSSTTTTAKDRKIRATKPPKPASSPDVYDLDFDWESVAESVFRDDESPILLFDGVCNFCNGGVNMCLDLDEKQVFRFASLQSRVGQALLIRSGKHPEDWSSLVLVTHDGHAYFECQAVLRVAERLEGLPRVVQVSSRLLRQIPPIRPILNGVYKVVAKNRYLLGESAECRIDWDGSLKKRFVADPSTTLNLECNKNEDNKTKNTNKKSKSE